MQKLLDAIEQSGFQDERGHLLTNCREWHQLRQQITALKAYAVEADKVVKLVEAQHANHA